MTVRTVFGLALVGYLLIGQVSMMWFHARASFRDLRSRERRAYAFTTFGEFAEYIGGYFLDLLAHWLAWPYYAGRE